ncbi:MAG: hypothetical protein IPM68_08415 [Flavobacteriales bacterium]|nr:hypothetical protein [Flavobacteriales bacterium]
MLTVDPGLAYFIHPDRRMIPLFMLALMSAAFPLASIQLLVRARVIDSLELHRREDRVLPYGITFIYYVISWYLLFRTPLHPAVPAVMAGASAALLFTLIITLQWKISAHMVGIGGMVGALAAINSLHALDLFPLLRPIIVLAGMLGTARLLIMFAPADTYTDRGCRERFRAPERDHACLSTRGYREDDTL